MRAVWLRQALVGVVVVFAAGAAIVSSAPSPPLPAPPSPQPKPFDPCPTGSVPSRPWCNTSMPVGARVDALVQAMTLSERIAQLSTMTPKTVTPPVPRLGVPAYPYHSEGLHGLRDSDLDLGLPSTLFPQTTGLAATGNVSLIAAMARVMAYEARALANVATTRGLMFPKGCGTFYWSPTMNVCRDPRWGRCQESISEDPTLLIMYSVAFVNGFQRPDAQTPYLAVAATCKHMMAYSVEGFANYTRHNFNAVVNARDFNETYLPPFAGCVQGGKPAMVMCSYPSLNGVPNCASSETLTTILRQRWRYTGLVVSDQGAVENVYEPAPVGHGYAPNATVGVAEAINAGCDQNDGDVYAKYLPGAVAAGLVTDATVTTALQRVMRQRFLVGAFDPPAAVPWANLTASDLEAPAARQLALDAGRQSITLLANRDNVLPLQAVSLQHVAVVGPFANSTAVFLGGKPDYSPSNIVTALQGVVGALDGTNATVTAVTNCSVNAATSGCTDAAIAAARAANVTLLFVGIDASIEHEGADRTAVGLPPCQEALVQAVAAAAAGPVVVVLIHGGPVSSDFARTHVATVVDAFQPGQFAGTAIADVLLGAVSPGGVLPYTLYAENITTQLSFTSMDMRLAPGRTYRFFTGAPLWPFGYGESYTTFVTTHVGPAVTTTTTPTAALTLSWRFNVTNTGNVAGAKVVMAFARALSVTDAPLCTMFGMQRVFLQPGETTTVSFAANPAPGVCALCTVDSHGVRAVVPGTYVVEAGGDGRHDNQPGWYIPAVGRADVTVTGDAPAQVAL